MNFDLLKKYGYSVTISRGTISIKQITRWQEYLFVAFIFAYILLAVLGAELADGFFVVIQLLIFTFLLILPLYLLFLKVKKRIVISNDSIELRWPWVFGPDLYIIPFTDIKSLEFKDVKNRNKSYHILMEINGEKKRKTLFLFSKTKDTDFISLQHFSKDLAEKFNVKDLRLLS